MAHKVWFITFLTIRLSTRSSMERNHTPLELLWEGICEKTYAVFGQLTVTGRVTH
jgi:hypothetical protein